MAADRVGLVRYSGITTTDRKGDGCRRAERDVDQRRGLPAPGRHRRQEHAHRRNAERPARVALPLGIRYGAYGTSYGLRSPRHLVPMVSYEGLRIRYCGRRPVAWHEVPGAPYSGLGTKAGSSARRCLCRASTASVRPTSHIALRSISDSRFRLRAVGAVRPGLRVRPAPQLVATTADARTCATPGWLVPAAVRLPARGHLRVSARAKARRQACGAARCHRKSTLDPPH